MHIGNFIEELKRRNVVKVAMAYAVVGWLIIQVATSVFPAFNFPSWTTQFVVIVTLLGLPVSLIIAWAFELTPDGIRSTREAENEETYSRKTGSGRRDPISM